MKTILIIGGGAAGMLAAISASGKNKKVIILEHNEKLGKKLFITGKGRCNITNACPPDDFFQNIITNPRFLYSAFSRFNNQDMMDFLKREGLSLKVERGQRVFPSSDRASDVIQTLKRVCKKKGVEVRYRSHVTRILLKEPQHAFAGVELADHTRIPGDSLILASGGASYPSTGADGSGYDLARAIGHTIRPLYPSLVPFETEESWCAKLMGLTLKNISVKLKADKKVLYEEQGELLFTHFGVSGPLVLSASTMLGGQEKKVDEGKIRLHLDMKPALSREVLDKRLLREFDMYRNKNISTVADTLLPRKMTRIFLELAEISPDKKVRDVSRKERLIMIEKLKDMELHVKGVRGFSEAIITRGGVSTREINPSTMESRLVKGVFFAGEIIDTDARTGGFNLQIAWSTGYLAGKNA